MTVRWRPLGKGASLRLRLLALSVAALLPGFLVLGYTQVQIDRSRKAEILDLATRSAVLASSELDRIVSGVQNLLVAVSRTEGVRDMADPACSSYLAALQPDLPHLIGLTVIDAAGQFRCGSTPAPENAVYRDRAYFQDALRHRGIVLGQYTVGRFSGKPVLPVALAMRDAAGAPTGVVVAAIDLAWLGGLIRDRGVPPGGSLTVADINGTILVRQPFPERFVGAKIPDPFLRLVKASAPGAEVIDSQDGTSRVLGYVPVVDPLSDLYVSAGLSTEVSFGTVSRAAYVGGLLAAFGALATLGATWLAGRRFFVRPVESVTSTLRRWREGDRTARTGFSAGHGELGELGAELDRMMDEIVRSQDQRELLAGELAHRVKNTLATVHAIAASTLNKVSPGREILPDYLARIAALARTHDVLTSERWEGAELHALIRAVTGPLVVDHESRMTLAGASLHLRPSEVLGMTMVLHELCTNALKYGALSVPDGRVSITWATAPDVSGPTLTLTWRERGGPPVVAPGSRLGFGTRLMARAFGDAGEVRVHFEPEGVLCRIDLEIAETAKDAA
ncbi:hypothetical protein GCM10007036_06460 [Alsobacter metallidurans]|uniref:histidine kinase n=1 Tax=Alsobacter metallidurans TaxID=340221 RepID=A0A917I3Y0_9HYPH|nr:HWE histidine kinase domain-containing protein [Alsobacter metallidurans]GGH10085.1 hypothetical protein GCM10007036_06460 [Alsobacter metallidurans]